MALTKDYTFNGDFPIVGAYLRINNISIEYNPAAADAITPGLKFIMRPTLEVRPLKAKNKIDTWRSEQWIATYDHTSNTNAIKQAYIYLKSLPEFSGAIDANE